MRSPAAAGGRYSLFLTADGTLWAAGYNQYGQLGNGMSAPISNPTPISVASNVLAVAAGYQHSLFVTADGTLWAMGYNNFGQLGNGTDSGNSPNPTPVSVGSNVVAVAAGFGHSLFLKSDGTLWAMGMNYNGQLGNTKYPYGSDLPISVTSNVVATAAGYEHSLFLKNDGRLWAMGYNIYGQLGNGDITGSNVLSPQCVASNVVTVSAGGNHSLFVTADGTVWAMGWNNYGQLGNGTTSGNNSNPTPISVASNGVATAAGYEHSLFLKNDGTLWAMGYNIYGQLGNGTTISTNQPVLVASGLISSANSGNFAYHSLAIGQMPASAATQSPMPVTATNAILNGMALPNGLPTSAWFEWGMRGSFTQSTSPVNVGSGYTVVRVSALISGLSSSNVYQCSLVVSNSMGVTTGAVRWFRADYAPKVAAWGENNVGQLQIPQNLTNVVSVAGGAFYSLALRADGTVCAWGDNALGECNVPASATNVVALGTGYGQVTPISLALRSDGTVVAWGSGVSVPAGLTMWLLSPQAMFTAWH